VRPRCSYCDRPVRPAWLRCPVCKTRRWTWYLALFATALAAGLILFVFLFRESEGRFPF